MDDKPFSFRFVAMYIFALIAVAIVVFAASCDRSSSASVMTSNEPVSMIGTWHQTENGIPGVSMSAEVTAAGIQVNMQLRDSDHIYWLGTFDSTSSGSSGIKSLADQDALSRSLFGSSDKTKMFSYSNGDLSFKFSMMGSSTTVHLSK